MEISIFGVLTNELCNARVIVSNNSDHFVDQSKSSFLNIFKLARASLLHNMIINRKS